jgi:uronate dehydrogenase
MTKVALSGANGQLGQLLRLRLLALGVDLRSADRHPLEPLRPGEDLTHGDLRDPENVDRLLQSVDILIHLAGTSVERPLPEIIENNLVGLHAVYEGAPTPCEARRVRQFEPFDRYARGNRKARAGL